MKGSADKKELVNSFYFGGLYPGQEGNEKLWSNVQDYINKTYDTEYLKRIFISGDGAAWVKSGVDILDSSRPMGWSQTGADRMSKLRCYEKKYGREGIINLVRYSREQRKLRATGTEGISVKEASLREIRAEHYNQAMSYIERIQAQIPGLTAKKAAFIKTQLRLL